MLPLADQIYTLQASILKTIASPRRLEMIHVLGEMGPMEVRRLAVYFDLPQPTISQHLAALRSAGLVEAVRTGREVRYQLVDPDLVAACDLMRQLLIRRMARMGDMAASYANQAPALPDAAEALS
ncbi:MAG TPA: metalloregulator ArsR/SmtB family transcription factor [Candidatus Limnocylindrales bacterium]